MVQPTHDRQSDHLVPCILTPRNRSLLLRDVLCNPLMRPCLVEVHDILIEDTLELLLMEDQQVVQAFLSYTPHEPLTDGIGSWGMYRRLKNLNGTRRHHASKARPKFAIVITNQVLWRLPIRRGFSELLCHPRIGRRACHAYVDHLARMQFDNEEHKERPKEEISDLQEVTGPDLCHVSAQKRAPLLPSWLLGANRPQILLNGALADMDAQFQEFSANPLCTEDGDCSSPAL
jgi:hypothetical protein